MNAEPSPLRTVAALGATIALTLAACGGDDDAAPSTEPPGTTAATGGGDTPMQPAAITVEAQESDGSTVTVAAVELPAPGFIAVHGDAGGSPGPVIGTSDLLDAGSSRDVTITLTEPLTADATVFPMVHIDTDGNGVYEFGTVEGVDGPGVTADGEVAVTGAAVTVTGDDEGAADDLYGDDRGSAGDADGSVITIADFAFGGVSEVPVGTTVVVTNTDGTSHTWTAVDDTFDSGRLGSGDSFEFTFTEPGEFDYFCNFHPSMTGRITVTD